MMAKQKTFPLRLPPRLEDKVKESSTSNLRSINAEITYALLQYYENKGDIDERN